MPTTTESPDIRRRRGFTLVEILVATGLSGMVMAAILSAVLMITRSVYLINNYIEMEGDARTALENFAVDSRMTSGIEWGRSSDAAPLSSILLYHQDGAAITYTYDSAAGTLVRSASDGTRRALLTGIRTFSFTAYRYDINAGTQTIDPATKTLSALANETKMVQLSLEMVRARASIANATNTVVSALFVLRNKIITN